MKLMEELRALALAGRPEEEGVALIRSAADRGDPEGHIILANWKLFGLYGPRDARDAHRHLEAAERKGSAEAARMRAYLTANGTGCEADPDAALQMLRRTAKSDPVSASQIDFLSRMMPPSQAERAPRERLSADPRIEIVRGLLLPEECDYVMRAAEPTLKPSRIDDSETVKGRLDPIRMSYGTSFMPFAEDLVLRALALRIASATGTDVRNSEALHILRYSPGQEYKLHHDALAGLQNQRACTAITYLNDGYEGGATVFPDLGLTVRGNAGDVLIFANLDALGRADPRMRHAGLPVTRGLKWIATRWIRQHPHDPFTRG